MSGIVIDRLTLVTLSALVGHALLLVRRAFQTTPAERGARIHAELAWLALCVQALGAWPDGNEPKWHPFMTARMLLPVVGLPWRWAERLPASSWGRRIFLGTTRIATLSMLGFVLWSGVRWLVAVRPQIGSVDFWAYVLFARDLADGVPSEARLFYFPGVYWFWRAALALSDRTLPGLQLIYALLLAANAGLVAIIVWRDTRSRLWAGLSLAMMLLAFASLQGEAGCTEPISTVAALLGLLAWNGGRRGVILLGVGLGAAFFSKQPGGLLALGWLGLVARSLAPDRRGELRRLAWVPAAAAATVALGFAFSGGGHAFIRGLKSVPSYGSGDTMRANLTYALGCEPLLVPLMLVGALALLWPGTETAEDRLRRDRIAFALVAALATLLQFQKRRFPHYALMTAPFAVLAGVIGGCQLQLRWQVRRAPLVGFAIASYAAIVLYPALPRLPPASLTLFAPPRPALWPWGWEAQRDLAAVAAHVRPGEELLLLPPHQNQLHFLLGTRSRVFPPGYFWGAVQPWMGPATVRSPEVRSVLQAKSPVNQEQDEARLCEAAGCAEAVRDLPGLGFVPVVRSPTMTLWQRPVGG